LATWPVRETPHAQHSRSTNQYSPLEAACQSLVSTRAV